MRLKLQPVPLIFDEKITKKSALLNKYLQMLMTAVRWFDWYIHQSKCHKDAHSTQTQPT